MNINRIDHLTLPLFLLGAYFFASSFFAFELSAQTDPEEAKKQIEILEAEVIERDPNISDATRLVGNVKLGLGDAILTCDSAYRFDNGQFEVFSSVYIYEISTSGERSEMWANYAVLDPESEMVDIREGVRFVHEEFTIECPSLQYGLNSKSVSYVQSAQIIEGDRILTSDVGVYSSLTDRLYAGGNVEIIENEDRILSDSLAVDRNDKTLLLFKHSVIDVNGALIACERGKYDGETEKGWFAGKASIKDIQGLLSGDSIVVNRKKNEGQAWGNVTVCDSSAAMTVCGDYASRRKGSEIVKINDDASFVKLINIEGEDTLKMNCSILEREQDLLFAYGGVIFEQGSFSGDGDSLSWDRKSDEIWLLGEPVVWSEEDEMTSDSVKMVLKQNKPSVMKLIGRANVFSPANDSLDHKISGRNLDATFKEGKLHKVDVIGNGTVLYYSVDGNEKMSRNNATCAHIQMLFSGGSVTRITLLSNPEGRFEELNNDIEDDPMGRDNLQKKRKRPDL
tara:strand:+ start:4471 stop:5997 length:1527 start_codon:yes stop_codon:yes gene_type:complete